MGVDTGPEILQKTRHATEAGAARASRRRRAKARILVCNTSFTFNAVGRRRQKSFPMETKKSFGILS